MGTCYNAYMSIGGVLFQLLKSQNYPINQYSKDTGLSRSQLYKIFSGQHSPTLETVKKLTLPLNISVGELIDFVEADTADFD